MKNIIARPAEFGVKLPPVQNEPYFVQVTKTRDIDVKLAAQLAELPMEEFRALNPQFNRPVIPGTPNTRILLPELNAEKFKENLSKWTKALSSWTVHTVTSARERIDSIAARFKTTPAVIREANSIPPNMRLKAGSTVLVPKAAGEKDKDIADEIADKGVLAVEPDVPDRKKITVKAGKRDTLASVAKRYKVSVAQLREWNDLKGDKLAPESPAKAARKPTKTLRPRKRARSPRRTTRPTTRRRWRRRTRNNSAERVPRSDKNAGTSRRFFLRGARRGSRGPGRQATE